MEDKSFKARLIRILIFLVLIIFAVLELYPFLWMIVGSFKNNAEIFVGSWHMPRVWRWDNFQHAWSSGVSSYLFNSLFVTVVATALSTIISAFAAYPLARVKMKLNRVILMMILSGLMLAPQVALIPLYKALQTLAIYNTYWAMILPDTAFRIPFTTFLIWSYFLTIPKELEEAAFADGAGTQKIFWKIILPVSKPILATSILLSARVIWNEFLFALIFVEDNSLKTITVGLKGMISNTETNWGIIIAGMTLSTAPIIILFLAAQKQFIRGMAAGSVKG